MCIICLNSVLYSHLLLNHGHNENYAFSEWSKCRKYRGNSYSRTFPHTGVSVGPWNALNGILRNSPPQLSCQWHPCSQKYSRMFRMITFCQSLVLRIYLKRCTIISSVPRSLGKAWRGAFCLGPDGSAVLIPSNRTNPEKCQSPSRLTVEFVLNILSLVSFWVFTFL